jgi:hypothetical protein
MPLIILKLAKIPPGLGIMTKGYAISGADPDDRMLCRKTAPIVLYPGNQLEIEVTHGHLTYLVGDRMLDVEVIEEGPAPVEGANAVPQKFTYPWQEVMERRKSTDKSYQEEQERKAEIARLEQERDERQLAGGEATDTAPTN